MIVVMISMYGSYMIYHAVAGAVRRRHVAIFKGSSSMLDGSHFSLSAPENIFVDQNRHPGRGFILGGCPPGAGNQRSFHLCTAEAPRARLRIRQKIA